jgi:hypothetical protein
MEVNAVHEDVEHPLFVTTLLAKQLHPHQEIAALS